MLRFCGGTRLVSRSALLALLFHSLVFLFHLWTIGCFVFAFTIHLPFFASNLPVSSKEAERNWKIPFMNKTTGCVCMCSLISSSVYTLLRLICTTPSSLTSIPFHRSLYRLWPSVNTVTPYTVTPVHWYPCLHFFLASVSAIQFVCPIVGSCKAVATVLLVSMSQCRARVQFENLYLHSGTNQRSTIMNSTSHS